MSKRQKHKMVFWAASTVVIGAAFFGMIQAGWFVGLNYSLTNLLYWNPENRVSDELLIVAIDDKTLENRSISELGTLQIPKADYARVIENLNSRGAAAIGVDVILSEQSAAEDVADLEDALLRYANVVIAAEPARGTRTGLLPLEPLLNAQPENVASVLFVPDRDNVVRRQTVVFEDKRASVPLSVALVNRYLSQDETANRLDEGRYIISENAIRVGQTRVEPIAVPVDENNQFLINFFGAPKTVPRVSFIDVLQGEVPNVENKIILIGEIGTALHDEQFTPVSFGEPMPGVEIHAHAIQTMLSGRYLEEASGGGVAAFTILLIAVSLAVFLLFGTSVAFATFLFGIILYTLTGYFAFEYGKIYHAIFPNLALLVTFVVAYVYRYLTEARKQKETQSAFGRYVSPHVVHEILENPDQFSLGGEKKELTVLFSDIAGFTSISEQLDPTDLVEQLNEYLDQMSEVILSHDGTIDKYIGDAVMAIWNAPIPQEDHAVRACVSALEYQEALTTLNRDRKQRGLMAFEARIGLNTGEMVVGNMGSTKRFDYTVIGDAVNLGARLEGVNKTYGTKIIISESTYILAKDAVEVRELDLIAVKGKQQPVRIYELLGRKGELSEEIEKVRSLFSLGLDAYRVRDWEKARQYFEDVLARREDGPSKMYLARIEELKTQDLPDDWDGVFVAKTK